MEPLSKQSIEKFIRENIRNLSTRPDYYSGRRASTSDLTTEMLHKLYLFIKTEGGDEAAKNYVQMIADLKDMMATRFLESLYNLAWSNWKWKKGLSGSTVAAEKDNEMSMIIGLMSVMGSTDNELYGMTDSIREPFLKSRMSKEDYEARQKLVS